MVLKVVEKDFESTSWVGMLTLMWTWSLSLRHHHPEGEGKRVRSHVVCLFSDLRWSKR